MTDISPDDHLDLIGEVCPMNFVKAKLKLETMAQGSVLEILLDSGEAVQNVPGSLKDEGHKILQMEEIENGFRLYVRHK